MAAFNEYKLLKGPPIQVEKEMQPMVVRGWRPVLMTVAGAPAADAPTVLFVMMEHRAGEGPG